MDFKIKSFLLSFFKKVLYGFFIFFPLLLWAEVDFNGFFRVRGFASQMERSLSEGFLFNQTLALNGRFRPDEKLQSQFWIYSSPFWFKEKKQSEVRIYGKGEWFISDELTLSLGKAPFGVGPDSLSSQNEYELYPSLFEGAILTYRREVLGFHMWSGYFPKETGSLIDSEKQGEYSLGIKTDIKMVSSLFNQVTLHLIYLSDSLQTTANKRTRYGLSVEGLIPFLNLNYNVSLATHGQGFQFKSEENMYHVLISYNPMNWLGSRFFMAYHQDSLNYDPWKYDRHEHAGLLDLWEWGNLTYFLMGFYSQFYQNWSMEMRYYKMKSTQVGKVHLGNYGSTFFNSTKSLFAQNNLGWEWDLEIQKKVKEQLRISFLGGVFARDEEIKNHKNDPFYIQAQMTVAYEF